MYRENYETIKHEIDAATEKISEINKARNKLQKEMKYIEKKYSDVNALIEAKDHNINSLRDEVDKSEIKLNQIVHEKDELQQKLTANERTYDLAYKQFQEQLANIENISNQNRKQKEVWANNFQKEQKSHALTKDELAKAQATAKDLELTINNLKTSATALRKLNADSETRTTEVNSQLLKLAVENERSLRDAATSKKLLQVTKEECKLQIEAMESQVNEERSELHRLDQVIQMEKEDAFSNILRWHHKYLHLTASHSQLTEENNLNKVQIEKLKAKVAQAIDDQYNYLVTAEESQMLLDEFKTLFEIGNKENIRLTAELAK